MMDKTIKSSIQTVSSYTSTKASFQFLYFGLLCAFVFSIPLESLFLNIGFRSPPYYLGLACTVLSLFVIDRVIYYSARAPFIWLMLCSLLMGELLNVINNSFTVEDSSLRFKLLLMCVILLPAVTNISWRKRLLVAYSAGCVVLCVIIIRSFISGTLDMYTVGRAGEEMVRAIGMLSLDPNEFAMIILPTMIWALYRLLCGRKILEIAVLTALNMILLMAFVMAVSRTGTVLYLTGIIMLLFLRRGDSSTGSKTSKRLKLFISTVVRLNLLVALVLATDMLGAGQFFESLRIRFDSSIYEGQYGSRDVLSVRTLQLFLEHPMGVGLNNSPDYIDGNDPHNDYLRFLAENGIIGGLFMFFAVILLLKNIYQYYRKGEETWLVVSVVLMLLATGVFQGFSKRSFFFIYSFFIVAPSLVYGAKTVTRKAGVKFKRTLNNG